MKFKILFSALFLTWSTTMQCSKAPREHVAQTPPSSLVALPDLDRSWMEEEPLQDLDLTWMQELPPQQSNNIYTYTPHLQQSSKLAMLWLARRLIEDPQFFHNLVYKVTNTHDDILNTYYDDISDSKNSCCKSTAIKKSAPSQIWFDPATFQQFKEERDAFLRSILERNAISLATSKEQTTYAQVSLYTALARHYVSDQERIQSFKNQLLHHHLPPSCLSIEQINSMLDKARKEAHIAALLYMKEKAHLYLKQCKTKVYK